MHLVCLGVMKRLILYWKGPKGPLHARIGTRAMDKLSNSLNSLRQNIPSEFVRKCCSAHEVLRWKATEFCLFLLYPGTLVLSNVLSLPLYNHFMLLNVALTILIDPVFSKDYSEYAHELLVLFVNEGKSLW